jgi:hypothetical protein
MKAFFEMLTAILCAMFFIGLVFIFDGSPNVWDQWHSLAMGVCK